MTEKILKAIELRHKLHMHPELSEQERETKAILIKFLKENTNLEIEDRGKWFFAKYSTEGGAETDGAQGGSGSGQRRPAIAFRADMDAIKVSEDAVLPYASLNPGVSHKCGHDGHSSALCAFALEIDEKGADRDVYFIFQHAEETGSGAVECSQVIDETEVEEIYAVHNFPGCPLGTVCTRPDTINMASVGVEYTFTGAPTHASTPELGKNPAKGISHLVLAADEVQKALNPKGLLLATVVQIDLGERAFGVAASRGQLLLTVRGEYEEEMDAFIEALNKAAVAICEEDGLELNIGYYERFPETNNNPEAVEKVRKACQAHSVEFVEAEVPIRTSEDFGYFTKNKRGALIWLGAGENWPPLHSKEYDYNDILIKKTCEIFSAIMEQ